MSHFLKIIIAAAFLILPCAPVFAAECAIDGTCAYVLPQQTLPVSPAFINANPSCQNIKNTCSATLGIMVPTLNQNEWSSFITNHEACARLSNCGCSPSSVANGTVGVSPGCAITCNSGYTLNGNICEANSCSPSSVANGIVSAYPGCAITCDTGYVASNGKCVPGSCSPDTVANGSVSAYPDCSIACDSGYSLNGNSCEQNSCSPAIVTNGTVGGAPDCTITCDSGYTLSNGACVANTVNGFCGAANMSGSLNGPAAGALCSSGTPSAVSGTGPWTWSCNGSGSGTTATCRAGVSICGNMVSFCPSGTVDVICSQSCVQRGTNARYPIMAEKLSECVPLAQACGGAH